ESDLEKFIQETTATKFNGESTPKLVLVSPIPHEDLKSRFLPNGAENNANIELYTASMKKVAEKHKIAFVDVYAPMKPEMEGSEDLTINGVHLNDAGYQVFAKILDEGIFGPAPEYKTDLGK